MATTMIRRTTSDPPFASSKTSHFASDVPAALPPGAPALVQAPTRVEHPDARVKVHGDWTVGRAAESQIGHGIVTASQATVRFRVVYARGSILERMGGVFERLGRFLGIPAPDQQAVCIRLRDSKGHYAQIPTDQAAAASAGQSTWHPNAATALWLTAYTDRKGFVEVPLHEMGLVPGRYEAEIWLPGRHIAASAVTGAQPDNATLIAKMPVCMLSSRAEALRMGGNTRVPSVTFLDMDETFVHTDLHTLRGLWNVLTRRPRDVRMVDGMVELIRARSEKSNVVLLTASPVALQSDVLALAELHHVKLEGGIILRAKVESLTDLIKPLGYKLLMLFTRLADFPSGTEVNFFGDNTQSDPWVYSYARKYLTGAMTADQLYDQLRRENVSRSMARRIVAAALALTAKNYTVNQTLIRLAPGGANAEKLRPVSEDMGTMRSGVSSAMTLLHNGQISVDELRQPRASDYAERVSQRWWALRANTVNDMLRDVASHRMPVVDRKSGARVSLDIGDVQSFAWETTRQERVPALTAQWSKIAEQKGAFMAQWSAAAAKIGPLPAGEEYVAPDREWADFIAKTRATVASESTWVPTRDRNGAVHWVQQPNAAQRSISTVLDGYRATHVDPWEDAEDMWAAAPSRRFSGESWYGTSGVP